MIKSKTRRPHVKSRNGCLACKARHVKCDEQKPECYSCWRYDSACIYPPRKKNAWAKDRSPTASTSTLSPTQDSPVLQPGAIVQEPAANVSHLRLLHHYTMVTAKTLPADASNACIYSSFIVDLAFDHPFLLLALFALAALHLSRLQPERKAELLLEADRYHGQALARFRAEICEVTETNYKAVFSFSTVLFPYSCAMPVDTSLDIEHAFDSILSNVLLTRRVGPLVRDFYQAMAGSELGKLRPRDINITWSSVEPPVTTELVSLRAFVEVIRRLYPEDVAEAYSHAITTLEIMFDKAAQSPDPPSDALLKLWIHFVTPQYVELLSEKQPAALIILAHYGVLLGRASHYWFLEGVANQIVDVANALVPAEWSAWLDWPKTQVAPRTPAPIHDVCASR